ncbi:DEAD/DEAH box helicase [Neomegalonema sp.]|uniref:DEAD/DEAH box helicase n=1 Tax=Neomegalonema sp. TaxID=2039713 RepID=UPI00261A9E79|nr:DEAD/DEAH box helicase [Neomegalonema sp.]MDD2867321.1 DEAD/DEAH box helicase [Neomegalonema sp.]
MTFDELNLPPPLLQAIADAGYKEPTPIQAEAIPHALAGRDVLGIAQTGTGKTASFTLPMIARLAQGRAKARMPRSLILAPTRELAAQVAENFETYGKHYKLTMALLIGGVSFNEQDKLIDRGVDVLIATPGRLLDHVERGKLMLTGVQIMVVDEADRMLDMGFIPDIERIFKLTPFTRQTLFFSATMPPEIVKLTSEFLQAPVRVEVARPATTAETVTQGLRSVEGGGGREAEAKRKRDVLRAILKGEGDKLRNAIIFCNRKRDVGVLYKSLEMHGFSVGALHGDLDQHVRMRVLDGFRNGAIQLLVASDVAARGLDIPDVSHVFNFDAPTHPEDYVHRIGRTGRAGRSGTAYTLVLPSDAKYIGQIEDLIKKPIPRLEAPGKARAEAVEPETVEEAPRAESQDRRPRNESRRRPAESESRGPRRNEPRNDPRAAPPVRDRNDRPERGGRGRRRHEEEEADENVLGFGDHVPAFMLIPTPVPARRKENEGEEIAA